MVFPSKISADVILRVASTIIERDGHANLTLRGVASTLEVAPNAIYRYFASRDVLLAAVAENVMHDLTAAIEGELFSPEALSMPPIDRVRALGHLYARFFEAHPALYEIMTVDFGDALAELPQPPAHEPLWQRVLAIVEPLTGPERAPESAVALWGMLHGLWALRRARVLLGPKPSDVDAFAVDTFLAGLSTTAR
jgi:AcrR family transcriptional regulator